MPQECHRRGFLYTTAAIFGVVGVGGAAFPLIYQMAPDARARARRDIVDVDLTGLDADQERVVVWRGHPVFIVRRTQDILDSMRASPFVDGLVDPFSLKNQQPAYARNWHRSINPDIAVLVGICTACATRLEFCHETSPLGMKGGYVCPSCASHYDPAGRAYSGLSKLNLLVPPHEYNEKSELRIGSVPMHYLRSL